MRWTLLIVRELLLGPKRFSDLRERLDGISPSILTQRLRRVMKQGLVRQAFLPSPASLVVDVPMLLRLVSGRTPVRRGLETGAVEASGDLAALADLPKLFDGVAATGRPATG